MSPICGGTVSGREKWQSQAVGQLLNETALAKDVVIFSDVSRMARSTLQVLEMLECWMRRGISISVQAFIDLVADSFQQMR